MKPIPMQPRVESETGNMLYQELVELRRTVNELIGVVNSLEKRVYELENPEEP